MMGVVKGTDAPRSANVGGAQNDFETASSMLVPEFSRAYRGCATQHRAGQLYKRAP
jgi:hypothetical protein